MNIRTTRSAGRRWACRAALRLNLGALAMGSALAAAMAPQAGQAQETVVQIDLPAQSLDSALIQLGRQTPLQFFYSPETVVGLRTPAVQGSMTPEQALQRLLQGSGVTYNKNGRNVTLSRPLSDATQLAPVVVTGGLGMTEDTQSYTMAGGMTSATRLPLTLRETPQSVTVLTRENMDDQGLVTLSDAVRSTPGLVVGKSGPERDQFLARGFEISNITYDGLPTSLHAAYGGDTLLADLVLYDRIEVVRGAAGLTQGAGNPGAAINLVRKRPTRDTRISLAGHAGNWSRYGAQADVSGALNEPGTFRARAVAAHQDHDSFQDVVNRQRSVFYGIAEADLGERTMLTLGASHQKNDNRVTWRGLPVAPDGSDLGLPRSTYLGNDWSYWNKETNTLFAELEHRFANSWQAKLLATHIRATTDYFATTVGYDATTDQYNQNVGAYGYLNRLKSYEAYASGPFDLFGRRHELVLGASLRRSHLEMAGSGAVLYRGMDIRDWDSGMVQRPTFGAPTWTLDSEEKQRGVYITTRLNLHDDLKAILGVRADWFHARNVTTWASSDYKVGRQLTKYAGLIYDLDEHHSVYVSYTDIFQPQEAYDASMSLLEPILGKNYEVGLKGEYFDGALNASVAVFRIDQQNVAMEIEDQSQCPAYPDMFCYQAAGKVRSQGVDVEIQGALTPNWQLAAGYTFVDKKYRKDANPENIGKRASTELPRHQFKLSTMYRIPGMWAGGQWRVGGNLTWQSKVYYESAGFHSSQDAYAVIGLVMGYQPNRHVDVQLNINNLFDKRYYQAISSQARLGDNIYGEPRNVMLTARYRY